MPYRFALPHGIKEPAGFFIDGVCTIGGYKKLVLVRVGSQFIGFYRNLDQSAAKLAVPEPHTNSLTGKAGPYVRFPCPRRQMYSAAVADPFVGYAVKLNR